MIFFGLFVIISDLMLCVVFKSWLLLIRKYEEKKIL